MSMAESGFIYEHVKRYYSNLYKGIIAPSVATTPGRALAEQLGYNRGLLKKLDRAQFPWDKVFPCGCTIKYLKLHNNRIILNLGSGIGLDSFILHLETLHQKISVVVVNMDVVCHVLREGMLWAHGNSNLLGNSNITWVCGNGQKLPFKNGAFTDILLNGAFNLFEDKIALLKEIWRVLKPGGTVVIADIFTEEELPPYFNENLDAWAWNLAGALSIEKMREVCRNAGFCPAELRNISEIAAPFYTVTLRFRKRQKIATDS